MRTVSQIAEELNVSRAAVYQKVKQAGLSIDELTEKKQGNKRLLKDEAVEIIKQLFVNMTVDDSQNDDAPDVSEQVSQNRQQSVTDCHCDSTQLQYEIERLKAQLTDTQEQLRQAQAEKERLFTAMEKAHQLADQAQQLEAQHIKQIAALTEQKQKLLMNVEETNHFTIRQRFKILFTGHTSKKEKK